MNEAPRRVLPPKVLIVEDESLVAMLVEDMVLECGGEVVEIAGSFESALKAAGVLDLDFAIIDVNLNGQRAYPIADILRERGIPFAFATGYGAAGLPAPYDQATVLTKPFQVEDVERALIATKR